MDIINKKLEEKLNVIEEINANIAKENKEIKNKIEKLDGNSIDEVKNDIINDVNKEIKSKLEVIENLNSHIIKERNIIENLSKEMMRIRLEFENIKNESMGKIEYVQNIEPEIVKKMIEMKRSVYSTVYDGIRPLSKKMDLMERKIKHADFDETKTILTDVTTRLAYMEKRLGNIDKLAEKKIEEFNNSVRDRISEMRQPNIMEDSVKEIVNRIIFLESRIRGIETSIEKIVKDVLQERSRTLPIIIE
jgi:hypothetical protein